MGASTNLRPAEFAELRRFVERSDDRRRTAAGVDQLAPATATLEDRCRSRHRTPPGPSRHPWECPSSHRPGRPASCSTGTGMSPDGIAEAAGKLLV